MSARMLILLSVVAVVLLGGGAAALLLNGVTTARAPNALSVNSEASCAPQVKTAQRPDAPEALPAKPVESPVADQGTTAKVLARVAESLDRLHEKQSAVLQSTLALSDEPKREGRSRKRTSRKEPQPLPGTEQLKEIVAAQIEVQESCVALLGECKSAKLADLAADLEQVLRLLAAIVGNLTAREPDFGLLTTVMQQGVVEKFAKMRKGLKDVAAPKVEAQEIPAQPVGQSGPLVVATGKTAKASGDRSATEVRVEQGAKLSLGKGTLTLSGDFNNAGTLESNGTSLVMNGGDQNISGGAAFYRARFSGGTKRLMAGGKLTTTYNQNSDKNNPVLVIEAGCTLIVEKDSELNVSNAYGLRVEGTLIVDGGIVNCSFTHGHGVDGMNASWVKGSQLIIRSGSFLCSGDSSFDGTSVYLQGGELRVSDDIWGSGDSLDISGGVMSNSSGGGQFSFTGQVRMTGGRLEINQYEGRGFVVGANSDFWCTGGEIVIGGSDVSGATSGIVLARNVQLPNLRLDVSTRISTNTPEGTTLSVSGMIVINKGKKFAAQGRQVVGSFETGENFGVFEP